MKKLVNLSDPDLGRFITPDTIVQDPSDSQTFNRYAYCGNNPVNRIDPDGHFWKTLVKAFFAVVGFISSGFQPEGAIQGWVVGSLIVNDIEFATGEKNAAQWGTSLAILGASTYIPTSSAENGFVRMGINTTRGAAISTAAAAGSGQRSLGRAAIEGAAAAGLGTFLGIAKEYFSERQLRHKVWYGVGDDIYRDQDGGGYGTKEQHKNFARIKEDPNIKLIRNPSFSDLKKAIKVGYNDIILSLHGTKDGLNFSDGYHELSELMAIKGTINVKNLVVGACWPTKQALDWKSLKIPNSVINYVDIGTKAYGPHYSEAPIKEVNGAEIDRLIYEYIYDE